MESPRSTVVEQNALIIRAERSAALAVRRCARTEDRVRLNGLDPIGSSCLSGNRMMQRVQRPVSAAIKATRPQILGTHRKRRLSAGTEAVVICDLMDL